MGSNSHEERVLRLLTEARNREILSALDDAGRSLSVHELAERLGPADSSAGPDTEFERTIISLHHDRLPRLADAGLVAYDRDANRVAARATAGADAEWLDDRRADAEVVEAVLDRLRTARATGESALGVVEGRESAIEHGRRLADEADEELFLMYESDDLLEPACLEHARDALDRGVDIYLGSQSPDVRDLARRELPEVTLWEPQLDLTNAPSTYPKVGRFVLADRETLLLALLTDPDAAAENAETAVIANGGENPLVVLVRELLGPRLDHLDYQSEEFRSQLPF